MKLFTAIVLAIIPRLAMIWLWDANWLLMNFGTKVMPAIGFVLWPYSATTFATAMYMRSELSGPALLVFLGGLAADAVTYGLFAWWWLGWRRQQMLITE